MYFAGLMPVAEKIGDNLAYVSDDFPGIFGEIHRAAGFIHVPPQTSEKISRTEVLTQQTKEVVNVRKNIAIVNFPEGGTSGKYNGLGPYDLEPFKTGGYVIASKLGIRVIPIAQYFDKEKGLQLRIFKSYFPLLANKGEYERLAKEDMVAMQEWLNKQKAK
jgi:1-acyl-sn-glycerol-3-phosphate acyltransferase